MGILGSMVGGLLGGGGGGESSTTSTQIATLPSWVESPMKDLMRRTQALSNKGYEAFQGQRFSDFNQDEQNAFGLTRNMLGFDNQASQDISGEVARRGLDGFSQAELQPYMNPYTENVLDINKARQFDTFDQNQNAYRQRASQAGAFGGSRFGLGEAQMKEDFQRQISDYDQQGLHTAYNQGLSGAMQGTRLAGGAGMDLANLQGMQQQGGFADANALMGIGNQQRSLSQQGLDYNFEEFNREQAHPYQQLQFASGIYNPIGSLMRGSETTQTTQQEEGDSGFLGTAIGLGSMALGIPGVGAMLGGGLSGIGSSIGGAIGGGMMGAGTGMSAGLSAGQVGRMGMGGANGMFGPGFADGGLVTAQPDQHGADYMEGIAAVGAGSGRHMPQPLQPTGIVGGGEGGGGEDDGGGMGDILGMALNFMPFADGGVIPNTGGYIPQFKNADPYAGIRALPFTQIQQVEQQEQAPSGLATLIQTLGGAGAPDATVSEDTGSIPDFRTSGNVDGDGMDRSLLQRLFNLGITGEERDGEGLKELRKHAPKDLKKNKKYDSNAGKTDIDMLVRALYGETRGESKDAQLAVGAVIKNRAKEKGKSVKDVILQPKQFSAFNKNDPNHDKVWGLKSTDKAYKELLPLATQLASGRYTDPTGGATHYYNPSVVTPAWDKGTSRMTGRQQIGSHIFGQTAYADGGTVNTGSMTPFQRAIQQHITNPIRSGVDATANVVLDQSKGLQEIGQYFTQSEDAYYKDEPTTLDAMIDNAKLGMKANKLDRGQMPNNLQHMMNQVSPLAQAGDVGRVSLDPLNQRLMVNKLPQQEQAPQGNAPAMLMQAASQATGRDFTLTDSRPKGSNYPAPSKTKAPKKETGMNLPLMAFGAQLLSSNRGFKHALGDAVKVGITTKQQQDSSHAKAMQQQAQHALKQRNSDLQGLRVAAEMQRLDASAPYIGILKELELKKKLKDLSGEGDLNTAIQKGADAIMKNSTELLDYSEAYTQAKQVIMSNRVGSNLEASKPKVISYSDFVPKGK